MFRIRLKELREKAGYSQYSFAEAIGVSQSAVGNWEAGKREPNFEMMQRLADFFDVTIDYLLGRENENKPAANIGNELTEKDIRVAKWFRSLSPEKRQALLSLGDAPKDLSE